MSTTDVEHLRRVFGQIMAHLDAAPHGLPAVNIRNGHVYIEPTPEDLPGFVAAFGMAEARLVPPAISTGDDWVIVKCMAQTVYDGEPWQVWAPIAVTHAQYRALVAASARDRAAAHT